jgi:CRP-like cAMP-binding protein
MVVATLRNAMDFPKDCKECPVWKKSLFKDFDQKLINWITEKKETVILKKKDALFQQGQDVEGIFCHLRGLAKVVQKDAEGKVRFSRLVLPGDTSGHRSLFIETRYKGMAVVISDTLQACYIPKEDILHLVSSNPSFARNLIVKISSELVRSEEEQILAKEKTLRGRLVQLLCELSEAHAEPVNGNQYLVKSEITKVDIASLLSVANETIIRLMSDMKSEGLIGYQGKKILINDLEKLKSLS